MMGEHRYHRRDDDHLWNRRTGADAADALIGLLASRTISAWFDPDYTPGVALEDDLGIERCTEITSRPIEGQLQYSVPPVPLSVAPATATSANGKRILSFTGARYLGGLCSLAEEFVGTASYTAFALASRSVGGSMVKWSLGDSSGADNRVARGQGGTNLDFMNRVAAGAGTAPGGIAVPANTPQVYSEVFTGSAVSAWLHGAVSINNVSNTRAPAVLDELFFGAQRAAGTITSFLVGLGGPLAICSGVMSTPDRQLAESLFGAYYGYPI